MYVHTSLGAYIHVLAKERREYGDGLNLEEYIEPSFWHGVVEVGPALQAIGWRDPPWRAEAPRASKICIKTLGWHHIKNLVPLRSCP